MHIKSLFPSSSPGISFPCLFAKLLTELASPGSSVIWGEGTSNCFFQAEGGKGKDVDPLQTFHKAWGLGIPLSLTPPPSLWQDHSAQLSSAPLGTIHHMLPAQHIVLSDAVCVYTHTHVSACHGNLAIATTSESKIKQAGQVSA